MQIVPLLSLSSIAQRSVPSAMSARPQPSYDVVAQCCEFSCRDHCYLGGVLLDSCLEFGLTSLLLSREFTPLIKCVKVLFELLLALLEATMTLDGVTLQE